MEESTTVPHHDDIASSSMASASIPYVHYDVYIDFCDYNHCGRDAHTFATKLYRLLHSHQLQVFLDVPNLLFKGKIPADVEQAILAASAHITIFPPNYAQSQWCLDKLVLMIKSSEQSSITILPVFYYASPAELRKTGEGSKGAYAEALRYYEKNNQYNSQTVQDWREALSYVTNISGFVVNEDHAEEEILGKIVQTIKNGFPYGPRYDVFLSHRGPDTKKTLASALYRRLTSCGLRVFLDELEFVRGFRIIQQIEIAIQFAHVNIAILSPTYADSTWCMEELNLMVTSRATILPVFYRVTHSDLRYGVYVEALLNHRKKQRYDSMTLQNWGDTLSKVAELPDYYYYELDGNEEEQLDNIVKAVLKSVAKRSEHLRTCDVQNVVTSVLKDDAKVEITSEVQSSVVKSVLKDDAKVEISSEVQSSVFTVGQEIATFLASWEILSKAWEESHFASNSVGFSLKEYEGVAYVAFPSFQEIEHFNVKGSKYGEGNIQTNNEVFSDCLKGYDDQPALVHQGALKLFLRILEETDFKTKIYTDSKQRKLKSIIFVGHSLGGAVATLATLWVLGKRVRQSSPFCITFGCPLVGDERLVEAVGRENWGGNFLHVVSQHDIVPRMLLAPLEFIAKPLTAILPYWQGKVPYASIQDVCRTLLKNVQKCTSTVAYYGVDSSRGSSPYKPFGTYMFCSGHGAACIDRSETVSMMLHLTVQSHEKLSDNIVQDWFSEHTGYGSVLKHVIEKSISGMKFTNPDLKSSFEMGISLQLEAIGVGAQNDHAQLALRRAGEIENKYNTTVDKLAVNLSKNQSHMAELEWYKELCENNGGIGYYDTFKNHQDRKDIRADQYRLALRRFWDDIIEAWEGHELPSDFQTQNKWINAGNTYRRFVEPLDIARYYATNPKGNYLSDGRENRHKVLQKWMEEKEKTRTQKVRTKRASLTPDSCFWAHVEEAWKDLENLKQGQQQSLQNLENFEKYATEMENALNISSDVFLEGSRFMTWCEEWKEYKKKQALF